MDTKKEGINMVIGILVFALILGFLGVAFVLISDKGEKDGFGEETTQTVETLGGANNTGDVSDPTDTGTSTDTTASTAKGHVLQLGDSDLKEGYIAHKTGETVDKYYCGFYTTALKANTKYRVSWTVNTSVEFVENLIIPTTEVDGVTKSYFLLNTSYDASENYQGKQLVCDQLSDMLNNSIEFTTEKEGDMVCLLMFMVEVGGAVTDFESASLRMEAALDFVTGLTFEEIVEG